MIRKAIERALEHPAIYNINQFFGQSTVRRYRALLAEEVPCDADTSVLDLGCGTGVTAGVVTGRYSGVDINPDHIDTAQRRYPHAKFFTMDCSKLGFRGCVVRSRDDDCNDASSHRRRTEIR